VPQLDPATIAPALADAGVSLEELGIDIIKVDRIRAAIEKFGSRFSKRVLTPSEQRYVRDRPETFAGRWAAKEAVSKVLGLGVRGIGWRDIEIERLPTGQPAVRLHGRADASGLMWRSRRWSWPWRLQACYGSGPAASPRTARSGRS
jgi:holo-[acyl-carrier protein] synthase